MNNNFLSYDLSLEMKGIGFNEPCFGYYVDGELRGVNLGLEELGGVTPYYQRFGFHTLCNSDIDNTKKVVVTAPTFSQALEFFEKEYSFFVDVRTDTTPNEILGFDFTIKSWKFPPMYVDVFMDKREGYDVVIKKMIELAKGGL